jgi:DNA-binding PadR family transcriptional regulator
MMQKRRGLRMLVLSMLSNSPKNGVEIMNEIEAATRGWWRPSPGSIYPLIKDLTDEGLVKKTKDDRYELTEKASEQMEWSFGSPSTKPQTVEEMLNEISSYVSYFEELNTSDQSKMAPHLDRLKKLVERLSGIIKKS